MFIVGKSLTSEIKGEAARQEGEVPIQLKETLRRVVLHGITGARKGLQLKGYIHTIHTRSDICCMDVAIETHSRFVCEKSIILLGI